MSTWLPVTGEGTHLLSPHLATAASCARPSPTVIRSLHQLIKPATVENTVCIPGKAADGFDTALHNVGLHSVHWGMIAASHSKVLASCEVYIGTERGNK